MTADPRFFIDEDLIGLGKLLTDRHPGVTWPGHRLIPAVPRKTKDRDWLPIVGEKGLVVISRDRHLRTRHLEPVMWARHRVKGFVLTGRQDQTRRDQLDLIEKHWNKIEKLIRERPHGPWMYRITKSELKEQSLPGTDIKR